MLNNADSDIKKLSGHMEKMVWTWSEKGHNKMWSTFQRFSDQKWHESELEEPSEFFSPFFKVSKKVNWTLALSVHSTQTSQEQELGISSSGAPIPVRVPKKKFPVRKISVPDREIGKWPFFFLFWGLRSFKFSKCWKGYATQKQYIQLIHLQDIQSLHEDIWLQCISGEARAFF